MFKKLKIENFKVFSSISVEKFSRVNVFFGKNNSGKSTLMEAVFLLMGGGNPELLLRCNHFRGYPKIGDFTYFFHDTETSAIPLISAEGDEALFHRELSIKQDDSGPLKIRVNNSENINSADNKSPKTGVTLEEKINGQLIKSSFFIEKDKKNEKGEIQLSENYKESVICRYMSPSYSFTTILETLQGIINSKQKGELVEALRFFDDRIKDFNVVGKDIMVDLGFDRLIPFNFIGDGARKYFAIATNLYSCKNGVFIVDEIDNGLHYSAMGNLWKIVLQLSRKYNVQVFATTHNIDSLKGLDSLLKTNEEFQADVSFYKLLKIAREENKALYYDYTHFAFMLDRENEIR